MADRTGFKGCNSLDLSKDTMIEAIQHYFDSVLFVEGKSPKVINISKASIGETFTVMTRESVFEEQRQ